VSKNAGYVLIASGAMVVALGVVGAISSGDEEVVAGATGPTGVTTGSETGVTGSTTGATGATTAGFEPPEAFLSIFSAAFRQGDGRLLFDRLHPVVVEFYGVGTCRAFTRGFIDPNADFVFISTSEPGQYHWEVDGVTTPVEDVLTVRVMVVSADGETERDIHLGIVGTELRWFADCGEPA
jgi:hypothetical protein